MINDKVKYCIFRRKDLQVWQWIAGGVEDFDKDIISAAKRVIEKIISNDLRRDGNGGIKM